MGSEPHIRALTEADLEAFKTIRLEALRKEREAFASHYQDWAQLSDQDWLSRLVQSHVHGAFASGEIVGLIGLLPETAIKMAHRGSIVMVYLRKEQRGSGLARAMLEAILQHARLLGLRQLELSVSSENPAGIRFYEREGFVIYGRLPNGVIEEDGSGVDDILMVHAL